MSEISLHPEHCGWAWHGVAAWHRVGDLSHPWRISPALTATAHNEHFTARVRTPAGVRAEVRTDASGLTISGELGPGEDDGRDATLDVVVDGALLTRIEVPAPPPGRTTEVNQMVELPAGPKTLELWLPHRKAFAVRQVLLHRATTATEAPTRPRWLAYGSSITHCVEAHGPSETWPALVARALGLDLYGLGLGGQCHLDHAVGETIADRALDALSLCVGINIYSRASYDERSLASTLHGLLDRTRRAHPRIPIVLMSPTFAPRLEEVPNRVDLTLRQVRDTVRRVAAAADDERLTYIDGRDVIGPDDVADHLREDELHPTAEGYRLIARRLTPRLGAAFGPGARTDPPDGGIP